MTYDRCSSPNVARAEHESKVRSQAICHGQDAENNRHARNDLAFVDGASETQRNLGRRADVLRNRLCFEATVTSAVNQLKCG